MPFIIDFLYSQLLVSLPYPAKDFSGETVIVTGSNTGLGLEAARHFVRLNAEKVVLAVRSIEKGEAAKKTIEDSTDRRDAVEVWQLDLSSYESVKQFVKRANLLKRIDVVVENAGMVAPNITVTEKDESTITTNVVSTFLLALLILPKLRESATKFNVIPRLVVVASGLYVVAPFPERKAEKIFDAINSAKKVHLFQRYQLSKLLEVLVVRELSGHMTAASSSRHPNNVILNCTDPGACYSDFGRNQTRLAAFFMSIMSFVVARSTEVGSRALLAAASMGQESHGQYVSDCRITQPTGLVASAEGVETQGRVWSELLQKLEEIQPGISQNI